MAKVKKIYFYIKGPPHKGRCTFAVEKCVKDINRKRIKDESGNIQDERIEAINTSLKKKKIDATEARKHIEKIVQELRNEIISTAPPTVWNNQNQKILDDYLKIYNKRRKTQDCSKKAMRSNLNRAIKSMGKLSLRSATLNEIQDQIDSQFSGAPQIAVIKSLRQLLKFVGRHDVACSLETDKKPRNIVSVLSMEEIDQLAEFIDDPVISPLVKLGAKCSTRLCEAYGVRKKQVKGEDLLWIDNQLLSDGNRKLPKREKERMAYVIQDGMDAINSWVELPDELKEEYRKGKKRIPTTIKAACQKLWKHDKSKHLNFRDLRHCYAVHLLSIGIPLETVADYMGNTPEVCRVYYKGYIVHELAIKATRMLANSFDEKNR